MLQKPKAKHPGTSTLWYTVTRTQLIFGVDQSKLNRRNGCRRAGASRPRCAARIPDRSTGTADVYAQHAFPPKVSGRTTRPRCVRGGQPDWPGIASSFRAFAPSSFINPFTWSVHTRNLPLACPLCAVRERRVAGSLPEVGRRDRQDRQ